jgi:hypothetical protein
MNTKTLLGIGVVGVLAYYLLRKKKKSETDVLIQTPINVVPPKVVVAKSPVTLSDIPKTTANNNIPPFVRTRNSRVLLEPTTPSLREPITINPTNLIPDVYSRGIGREINLSASGEVSGFADNFGVTCTDQINNACNCSVENKTRYKLDIPQLP